jgi:hypothetical protein
MSDLEPWQKLYDAVRRELDPIKQLELCQRARRAIQERLLELKSSAGDLAEQHTLEEALRNLWKLEQSIRKPNIQ